MTLECGACTHAGRRATNEDSYVADPALGLFAVADGMGGHAGGDVASRVAINAVTEVVARWARSTAPSAWVVWRAFQVANEQVRLRRRGAHAAMGTTLSLLLSRAGQTLVGHLGDSRVYRLRTGRLERLTRDHTLEQGLLAAGTSPVRARRVAHVLTRAVGSSPEVEPVVQAVSLHAGDRYLLCTDGLSDPLEDGELRVGLAGPPGAAATSLVDAARAAGGVDDVTALVVCAWPGAGVL